jgi:hypothetical protein
LQPSNHISNSRAENLSDDSSESSNSSESSSSSGSSASKRLKKKTKKMLNKAKKKKVKKSKSKSLNYYKIIEQEKLTKRMRIDNYAILLSLIDKGDSEIKNYFEEHSQAKYGESQLLS